MQEFSEQAGGVKPVFHHLCSRAVHKVSHFPRGEEGLTTYCVQSSITWKTARVKFM